MDLRDGKVLILGGWGLVGAAIARAILPQKPAMLVIHSLRRDEAEEAVDALAERFPDASAHLRSAWGMFSFAKESRTTTGRNFSPCVRRAV